MGTMQRIAARWAAITGRAAKAFFAIHDHDSRLDAGVKVGKTALKRAVYSLLDYWSAILSAVFIITMDQVFGYGPVGLYMLMWAFDIAFANTLVVLWKRTGEDVTLGEAYRRAADAIHGESRFAGYLTMAGVCVKASFWDGPEHIVIFFHKEIRTETRMFLCLLALTAVQAAIWTPVYVLGFESAAELWQHLTN